MGEQRIKQIRLPLNITVYEDDLISSVYEKLKKEEKVFYKKDLKTVFRAFTDEIKECLLSESKVQIKDFAVMKAYKPKPTAVRHPITGELIYKGKSKRIKVSPIGELKELLRIKREG